MYSVTIYRFEGRPVGFHYAKPVSGQPQQDWELVWVDSAEASAAKPNARGRPQHTRDVHLGQIYLLGGYFSALNLSYIVKNKITKEQK